MAIQTTLKKLVESIETHSLQKLAKDPNLSQTTKFLIDAVWQQAQAEYERYADRVKDIGMQFGHEELSPTDEDPNRSMFIFDTIVDKQANDKALKDLKEQTPVELRGMKLTLDQLKRTAFQQTPRGMKAIDANALDPLDADDYGRLDWLIDRPTEEDDSEDTNVGV